MPDWTAEPPSTPPPGPVDPPVDRIRPTSAGWRDWIEGELDYYKPEWGPGCRLGITVRDTGVVSEFPLDGPNPENYDNGTHGWTKDARKVETVPPAPYQDFTRWSRRYGGMRFQSYRKYSAQIHIDCGPNRTWDSRVYEFWNPEGAPRDVPYIIVYCWVKTSGIKLVGDPPVQQKWEQAATPGWTGGEALPDHIGARDAPPAHVFYQVSSAAPFPFPDGTSQPRQFGRLAPSSIGLTASTALPPAHVQWVAITDVLKRKER